MLCLKWISIVVLIASVNGYKILTLLPFTGPSHFLMFKVFIKELLDRGHEVTAITAFEYGEPLANYTEIFIDPSYPIRDKFVVSALFKTAQSSDYNKIYMYYWMGLETSVWGLENRKVQEFIKRDDLEFDLILAEQFFQESWLMFAHKYNAPIVTISTYGPSDFFDRIMGALTPWSHVPHTVIMHYGDNMNFFNRCYNFYLSLLDAAIRKFYYMPKMNRMATKYFGDTMKKQLPLVEELENSISAILVNSHFSINRPRPLMPGIVNIGGAHIKPIKPLPENLQKFLDGAKDGAIYFSLGAYMRSAEMPREVLEILLKVFGSMKQRVLWKYETDDIPDLPKNVMVQKWMPQGDVLAHDNVKLFISHGGLFGTIEGTYRGVPILFMPFFGDQLRNAMIAESNGYGLKLDFAAISEETLKEKLNELLNNKSYYQKAKEISRLFADNPIPPMEEAIFWIEYVIRNRGAKHLNSAAINLSWYQYLCLDIVGFIFLVAITVTWTIRRVMQVILNSQKTRRQSKLKIDKKNK